VVVLGVGNELMRDDGVGVHVVRRLTREPLDPRVETLEAGTAVADALDLVPVGAAVVAVDAASGGGRPGSTYRFGLSDLAAERGVSLHETSLPEAFALAEVAGAKCGEVVVVGVEPAEVKPGEGLSPILEARLPAILQAVRREVNRLLQGG